MFMNLEKINSILQSDPKNTIRVRLFLYLNKLARKISFGSVSLRRKIIKINSFLIPAPYSREEENDNGFFSYKSDLKLKFPVKMIQTNHIAFGYCGWIYSKYKKNNFVEIKQGDIVVETGAFIGGFTIPASFTAKEVHAFEPSPRNFKSLKQNCETHEVNNVSLYQKGIFETNGHLNFNISEKGVDDSFFKPDFGEALQTLKIETLRLDNWAKSKNIVLIDFLKVEAEGAEREIIRSIGNLNVKKIVVDVSAERDGKSDKDEIKLMLESQRYEVLIDGNVLFARKKF